LHKSLLQHVLGVLVDKLLVVAVLGVSHLVPPEGVLRCDEPDDALRDGLSDGVDLAGVTSVAQRLV
jgi:hypothetical protein